MMTIFYGDAIVVVVIKVGVGMEGGGGWWWWWWRSDKVMVVITI